MSGQVREIEVEIKNEYGLHMRPAMQIVDVASRYASEITVSNGETAVDAKSIMHVTMLAATCGMKLKITADGDDSDQALTELRDLIEVKMFDEPAG